MALGFAATSVSLLLLSRGRHDFREFRIFLAIAGAVCTPLALIWPVRLVLRKRKTGTFALSGEEREAALARRRSPKRLWFRILVAVFWCVFAGYLTMRAIVDPDGSLTQWVIVAVVWAGAASWIWDIFRRAKPKRMTSDAADERGDPPAAQSS
jgi:undecaprenyl pyrophosphate phosphatase UppP